VVAGKVLVNYLKTYIVEFSNNYPMENYHETALPKERLIDELREIRYHSLEGVSVEEFQRNNHHPIYAGFAEYFASRLEDFKFESVNPEEYTSLFVEGIKEAMRNIGRKGQLTSGQIQHAYEYFDSLTETVSHRILGDLGNSFTSEAIRRFNQSDFYDLYEQVETKTN